MYYKLRVTKQEENPQYEAKMKEYEEQQRDRYGYVSKDSNPPEKLITINCLEVIVNEEQWKAVQKAALEQFN